jgi:hypothetical protein
MRMNVPRELDALAAVLIAQSQLLAESANSERVAIYEAYGHDLQMMTRYRDAFRTSIEAAVRGRASPDHKDAQAFLDRVVAEIAPIVHEPTLSLSSEALKLEPAELLLRLQNEFRADVETIKQNVAFWLHILAESEYVSAVEWLNPTALHYHFFRMEDKLEELERKVDRTGNTIEGVTTTTTITNKIRVLSERRVHTIVNARAYKPDKYPGKVPERIARLIDALPAEVRPFVTIVDGNVTNEEVHRRLTSSRVAVETHSVYRPDPALLLFNTWAINGWGGSTPEAARSVYQGHVIRKANNILVLSLAATIGISALVFPLAGLRGAGVVVLIGFILTGLSQLGMRLDNPGR